MPFCATDLEGSRTFAREGSAALFDDSTQSFDPVVENPVALPFPFHILDGTVLVVPIDEHVHAGSI